MYLKHLILSFLAVGLVTAVPNPNVDSNNGVHIRDADVDGLDFDTREPDGDALDLERRETDVFDRSDSYDCGKEAYYDKTQKACVCKKKGQVYDTKTKDCDCPEGQTWDGYKCRYDCGKEAYYDKTQKACVCKKKGQVYDTKTKDCECPSGQTWNGYKCKKHY